jgi:hypothetical protein
MVPDRDSVRSPACRIGVFSKCDDLYSAVMQDLAGSLAPHTMQLFQAWAQSPQSANNAQTVALQGVQRPHQTSPAADVLPLPVLSLPPNRLGPWELGRRMRSHISRSTLVSYLSALQGWVKDAHMSNHRKWHQMC